jgi:uncharacterized membrane protein
MAAGTYTVNVTGTSGPLIHKITVTVIVVKEDFGIVAQTPINVPVGGSGTSILILTSIGGFAGIVTLAATVSPTGPSASLALPSLGLGADQTNATILTVSATASVSPGTYTVTVRGTSGARSHTFSVTVNSASDFTVSASPATLTVNAGFSGKSNVTLTSLGGFAGTATVSANVSPAGPTPSLNASSVILRPGGSPGLILTFSAPNGTAPGLYIVTVTATTGLLTHTATVTVRVILHDVAIISVAFSGDSATAGARITFNIVVQNRGTVPENATVAALVGDLTVAQKTVTLLPGEAKGVTLTWDTKGWLGGAYTLGAKVLQVPGQANTANNIQKSSAPFSLVALQQTSPLSPIVQASSIVVAIVAVAGIILFTRLRRRTASQTL